MDADLNPIQTNQTQVNTSPAEQPVASTPSQTTPSTQVSASQMPPVKSGGNKTILFVALGVLVVITLGVLYFLALNFNNTSYQASQITPIPQKAASPTPSVQTQATEADINTIDLGNPDEDINSINQDLGQL